MITLVDLILKSLITTLAGMFVGAIIVWIKSEYKKQKVYDDALKALSHDCFYRQCRYLLQQRMISKEELENLNYLYDAYRSLGMNGTGEELYRRCLKKPLQ